MYLNNSLAGPTVIPAGSITAYLQQVSGSNYVDWSEICMTSSMIVNPPSGSSNDPTFSSATFLITEPQSLLTWGVGLEIVGNWDFGVGGFITFQLVKV
jgi:hypothetical protein